MSISTPSKIAVPFANSGTKNSIPVASQVSTVPNGASYTDGFPPLTMTPKSAGGIPPRGGDMNGILYELTNSVRYTQAGGLYPYDSTFSTTVGGYPQGAMVGTTDGTGAWLNTSANNTTDPEAFGSGWLPYNQVGGSVVTMSNANVTLTALQAGKKIITITGTLTSNLFLYFPTWINEWTIINSTTGAFKITAKTASGTGVVLISGENQVYGDGSNIKSLLGTNLLSQNGYQIMPGGLIMQWMYAVESTNASTSISWPITFPNACLNAQVTPYTDVENSGGQINSISTTGIIFKAGDAYGNGHHAWVFSIGY